MSLSSLSVAFIGLGRMGAGIARNIQSTGCHFTVYNRTPEKILPFVTSGATAARSPREAAAAGDIVVTSLMDDASVFDSMMGEDGLLAGMRRGAIHIGTTTISPEASTRCAHLHAAQGSHYLAAPVFGRPDAAAAGKLFALVAGKAEVIERCRPILETYTQQIILLGEDPALAASMKLVGNFFLAGLVEVIGQAFVFAEKRGVLDAFHNMVKGFMPASQEYLERIRTRNFDNAGFTLDAGLKDIRLILAASAEVHVPLPMASLIRDKCIAAQARGLNQSDWACFTEIARVEAGQK